MKKSGDDKSLKDSAFVLRKALETITPKNVTSAQAGELGEVERAQGFPTFGKARSAAEAWSPGAPELSAVPDALTLGADLGNPQGAFLAGKLAQDAELLAMATSACGNQPHMREVAEQVWREARALARKQQGGEPTKVKIGQKTVAIPASIIAAPAALHSENPELADQLFATFCKGRTKQVMRNAAKCGQSLDPFVYLTQALWHLLDREHKNWQPAPRMDKETGERQCRKDNDEMLDTHFDAQDAEKGDCVRVSLECWAGPDLAHLILTRCYNANMSLYSGLRACYKKLDENRETELVAAQRHQTARQWIKDDEDDEE